MPALRLRLRIVYLLLFIPIVGLLVVGPLLVGEEVRSHAESARLALVAAFRDRLESGPDEAAARVQALAHFLSGPAGHGLVPPDLEGTVDLALWDDLLSVLGSGAPTPARLRVLAPEGGRALRVHGEAGAASGSVVTREAIPPEDRARLLTLARSGKPWQTLTPTGAVELGHPIELEGSPVVVVGDFAWRDLAGAAVPEVASETYFLLDAAGTRVLFLGPGEGAAGRTPSADVVTRMASALVGSDPDRAIRHRGGITVAWIDPGLWCGIVAPPGPVGAVERGVPLLVALGVFSVGLAGIVLAVHAHRRRQGLRAVAAHLGQLAAGQSPGPLAPIGDEDLDPVIEAAVALGRAQERRLHDARLAARHQLMGRIRHRVMGEMATASGALTSLGRRLTDPATPRGVFQGTGEVLLRLAARLERLERYLPDVSGDDAIPALDPQAVDLRLLLTEAVDEAGITEGRGIDVRFSLPPALPVLDLPQAALRSILRGLLENSGQAMPRGGTLKLEVDLGPEELRVLVIDTGCGMSGEFMARELFRPYATGWEDGDGVGLSLYRARRLLRRIGGDLDVASHPGVGTRVTLSLPLRPAVDGEVAMASRSERMSDGGP